MTQDLPTIDDVDGDELVGQLSADVPKIAADEKCRGKRTEQRDGESVFVGYCGARAGKGTGDVRDGRRCNLHGGGNSGENGQGAKENNVNAVTNGAFREHFTSHLTEGEQKAFDDAREALENSAGAKEIAQTAASVCLLQFNRTGDERFIRRYESICDKAGIFPNEEIDVNHGGLEEMFMQDLQRYHEEK